MVACLCLGAGCKQNGTPTSPTPTPDIFNYTVVGASDGIGFGGSVVCLPFEDCANGTGYAFVLKRRLQGDGRTVTLNNRALPGAVLSGPLLTLGREIGRGDIPGTFLDQVVPFVPSATTHVTVFAGGNDANVIAQAVRAGRGGGDVRAFIDAQVAQFGSDFEEMLRRIRSRAPNVVRIVVFNLPNLAAAPYVFGLSTQERSILQRIAVGLTDRINAHASSSVLIVDLMCEPRLYSPANFAPDGFHPNDSGYALMAELAYPALANGTAAPPSSSCAPRTALPVF